MSWYYIFIALVVGSWLLERMLKVKTTGRRPMENQPPNNDPDSWVKPDEEDPWQSDYEEVAAPAPPPFRKPEAPAFAAAKTEAALYPQKSIDQIIADIEKQDLAERERVEGALQSDANILADFDLRKAVIYSEMLNPKFKEH